MAVKRFLLSLSVFVILIAAGLWLTFSHVRFPQDDPPNTLRPTAEEQYALAVEHHQASAGLEGIAKEEMLRRAVSEYDGVIQHFSESPYHAAESHLAIGHIHQLLGDTAAALYEYELVAARYVDQSFTRLQALKSLGDARLAAGESELARAAYQKILADYDNEDQPPAVRQLVSTVRSRLETF